jgi:hypothetical protein
VKEWISKIQFVLSGNIHGGLYPFRMERDCRVKGKGYENGGNGGGDWSERTRRNEGMDDTGKGEGRVEEEEGLLGCGEWKREEEQERKEWKIKKEEEWGREEKKEIENLG